jgi:hypothetical protein
VKLAGPWVDYEHGGIAKMKAAPGHEVYALTAEQLAAWKKTAEPLTKSWAESVRRTGADPDTVMAELQASLAKYGAGF